MRSRGPISCLLFVISFVAASLTVHLIRRGSAVENLAPVEQRLAESAQGGRDSFLPEEQSSFTDDPPHPAADIVDAVEPPPPVKTDPATAPAPAPGSGYVERQRILRRAARFRDTSIPLGQREAEIRALAKRGDDDAVRVLIALAEQPVYLNRAAVEVLGTIRKPEVAAYLKSKLMDVNTHDVTLLCECIRSAGKVLGDQAVAEIAAAMKAVRKREDGHAGAISDVCIQTLGDVGRPEAVAPLKDELDHMCAQERLDLAHGAEIVKAYTAIGDGRAAAILIRYADFLQKCMPQQPMPRRYYEERIREARTAARTLGGNTMAQALARQ